MNSGHVNAPASVIELAEDDSWAFLRSQAVGRLAVSTDGDPDIFPINFVVAEEPSILFRTALGTKLLRIASNHRVAFEADHWNTAEGTSVVIRGRVRILAGAEFEEAARLPLRSWTLGPKPVLVRIEPTTITGRRLRLIPSEARPLRGQDLRP